MNQEKQKKFLKELKKTSENEGIQKFVVGAVIIKQDRVLLLQRPENDFMGGINELPSGNMGLNENIDEALKREVKEETNLNINKILKYLGHFDYNSSSGKNTRQWNFLVSVDEGTVKLTEHDAFFWADKDHEAFKKVTDSVKEIIEKIEVD